MLGFRKKPASTKASDAPQKKKWQLELEENSQKNENIDIENLQNIKLPDDPPSDRENIDENGVGLPEVESTEQKPSAELKVEETKKEKVKKFDWMDSDDAGDIQDEDSEDIEEELARAKRKKEVSKSEMIEEKDGGPQDNNPDNRTVFLNNLHFEASAKDLELLFGRYGKIMNIDMPRNEGSKFNKGRAFIEFSRVDEAKKALAVDGAPILNRHVSVTLGLNNATTTLAASEKKINALILPDNYKSRSRRDADDKKNKRKKPQRSSRSSSGEENASSENESESQKSDSDEDLDSDKESLKKDMSVSRSRSRSDSKERGRNKGKSKDKNKKKGGGVRKNREKSVSKSRSESRSPKRESRKGHRGRGNNRERDNNRGKDKNRRR